MSSVADKEDRPLRIVMVGAHPRAGEQPRGGVEAATQNLAQALWREYGLRSTVLVPSNRASSASLPWAEVQHIAVPRNPLLRRWAAKRLFRNHASTRTADIVHVQGDASLASALMSGRAPVVLTVHGVAERDVRLDGRPLAPLRAWVVKQFERRARERALYVIAISRATYDYLGVKACMVKDIPNPIGDNFFSHDDESPRSADLVFAGRLVPLKNVVGLIEAFADAARDIPHARLLILGSGPSWYRDECGRAVARHGLQRRVQFLGSSSPDELARIFARSGGLVLPSLQENAPMVIAEAMASGLTVLATDVGGVREMVEGYDRVVLVPPGNETQLARAIRHFLKGHVRGSGVQGTQWASRHRPGVVARDTLRFYGEVIEHSRRTQPSTPQGRLVGHKPDAAQQSPWEV